MSVVVHVLCNFFRNFKPYTLLAKRVVAMELGDGGRNPVLLESLTDFVHVIRNVVDFLSVEEPVNKIENFVRVSGDFIVVEKS